jgi:hypothetical protein
MNFSKKNHEHKIINIKNVSKKIILGIVFVFASITMVNANSSQVSGECTNFAMAVFYDAVDNGMSYEDAYNLSVDADNVCRGLNFIADHLQDFDY